MGETKNIFDYAKKELSQDAFLMWLFENYDCDEECIRDAAFMLLREFGIKADKDRIKTIKTDAQW
ncbi:MAG: hypothetical protein J6Y65_01260, partial [Eggerthellaceae bacterium]|nr:hypothetical protein [Eggerthellaceae bacterium]